MIKCAKCGLENLDHVAICVECGTPLIQNDIANAELTFSPPRAGKSKYLRLFFYKILRNTGSLNTAKPRVAGNATAEDKINSFSWGELYWELADFKGAFLSIIPGLGHLTQKRYYRAFLFFALWLAFILFGIMFYGRIISNIFFGGAISINAIAAFDCLPYLRGSFRIFSSRMCVMVFILIFIIGIYYSTFNWVSARMLGVWMNVNRAAPVFIAGDFLLIRRQDNYKRGDIIFYDTQGRRGRGNGLEANFYIPAGTYFDRLIGLPGEKIEIKDGEIFINGNPLLPELYPIKKHTIKNMEVILSSNQYFIYDSLTPQPNGVPLNLLRLHNVVEEDNIRGRAFMIYAPLSRMQFID